VHVVDRSNANRGGGFDERLHEHEAAALLADSLTRHLRDVSARCGFRDGVERERVFPAGEHQPLVAGRLPARFAPELRLERDAAPHQPVEVVDAARAVVGDPVLVGARPHGDVEECRHVVDGIVEAAGLLQSGAPAEVDEPARHRGGPAPATGSLEHEDVGTGRRGLNRGGGARDPVPGDHDIGFEIPVRDLISRRGAHVCAYRHGRIATGSSPVHWWPQ